MCIRCEEDNHISVKCFNSPLSREEQNILKDRILSDRDQPFPEAATATTDPATSATINNSMLQEPAAMKANSITYESVDLQATSRDIKVTEVLLEKEFKSNKRSHFESVVSLTVSLTLQLSVSSITPQLELSAG